jgi:hypothetical protein
MMKNRKLFQKNHAIRKFIFLSLLSAMVFTTLFVYSCSKEFVPSDFSRIKKETVNRSSNVNPVSDYVLWQIKDKPYTVIFTSSGANNHIWIVQNENNFVSESISSVSNGTIGFYNNTYLILKYGNLEKVYSLVNSAYQNYTANTVGLSKVIDDNLLNSLRTLTETTKGDVIDDVSAKATCKKDGSSAVECKCAGGENSTSCECSGSIAGFSWHEATSCKDGYFACCSGL